jgi:glycosyltransferase involved in cell wall biosynthesis
MVDFIYKHSDKILVQSEAFKEIVLNRCHDADKISYLPYWAEDLFLDKKNIDENKYLKLLPSGFKIMFAGNIGEAQDFESILKAAELTKSNANIKWIIVGDGRKKDWVESEIKNKALEETVYLLGRYPIEEMPSIFSHADIMLLPLKNEYIFSLTIPSKIQSYMAFGKPIITMLNGIGSQIVESADCGFTASAGDYESLAHNAIRASNMDKNQLNKLGENALVYYNSFFSKTKIVDDLVKIISETKS